MIYYGLMHGQGRELLVETLGDADPFSLPGEAIVERALKAGLTPDIDHPLTKPYRDADAMSAVTRGDGVTEARQIYLVAIDVEAETITVQEAREEAYGVE